MRLRWGIACILLMAACTRPDNNLVETRHGTSLQTIASPKLQAIDSLMWRQPDSALAVLLNYLSDDGKDAARHVSTDQTFDNHYTQLLVSELLYKNDYKQTNREDLLQAVSYFDSLTLALGDRSHAFWRHCGLDLQSPKPNDDIAFLTARAHYINGVGYYERDSVVEACKEYLKALEVMEGRFEEKDLAEEKAQFVAYTYTRLTDLFSNLYLHEQAICFAQRSLAYYQMQNLASWYRVYMLNEIGSQYDMLKQSDSATVYYQKAMATIDDTTILLYRDIAAHLICMEYKKGLCQADVAIKRIHNLLQNSGSDRERQVRYMNIGETFYHEQNYDSAWVYIDMVFQTTSIVNLKRQAAEWLIEICKIQGKDDDIFDFASFLVPFANQEENQSSTKTELTELYKAFGQVQQERKHRDEMRRHHNYSMAIVVGLLLAMLFVYTLYQNNKRRKRHLEKQINEEKHIHDIEKKALSNRLKKSNETLRELKDQIDQQKRNSYIKTKTQAANFMDEPICRLIMERVQEGQFKSKIDCDIYKSYALDKQRLLDLRMAADRHFSQFTLRLRKAYPKLTSIDIDYCCLYLLNLTYADVSALMQRAYNTVVERDGKIQKIIGSEKPLPVTLMDIAQNPSSI